MSRTVKPSVERLKTLLGDMEIAHVERDDIWHNALNLIIDCDDIVEARRVAEEALETDNIDIDYWYA
jgi:hypothetical protein